jgi:hypothetical protein
MLERCVARRRSRVEVRLWRVRGRGVTREPQAHLESLLTVPDGRRTSRLDQLRTGPITVSGPALVQALLRLQVVRAFGLVLPTAACIPPSRLASLARFGATAKVTASNRLPAMRRLATLAAFVHGLEATAHDNALEGLERLLRDLCEQAMTADTKARLRTLKELDQAATTWPGPCQGRRRGVVVRSPLPMAGGSSADPTGPGRTPSQVFWRRPWRHWVPPDVQPIQRPECHRRKT